MGGAFATCCELWLKVVQSVTKVRRTRTALTRHSCKVTHRCGRHPKQTREQKKAQMIGLSSYSSHKTKVTLVSFGVSTAFA